MCGLPVAQRRHRNDKREPSFKAPLAFMGGTLVKRQEKARNNVLKSFSVVIINNFPKYLNATVDVTWCWMLIMTECG